MKQRSHNFKCRKPIGIVLLLLISLNINSQQSSTDTIINYDDVVTFKPPSDKYIPLLFQTHNKLLRFGQQNDYSLKPDGSYISHHVQPELAKKIDKKNTQLQYGRQAISELLKLRFMTDVYADIDKELLTKYNSNMYLKDKNSYNAQQHLLKLAKAITSNKELDRYFCNPKKEDCAFSADKNVYYYRKLNSANWGGKEANEFQTLKSYTSYVQNNLEALQQWSNTIFPNNTIDGYFVVKAFLNEYDFNNKGYWLHSNRFAQDSRFLLQYHNLEPTNANERKLINLRNGVNILFELSPTEAEKLSEKTKNIYLLFKIKTTITGLEYQYEGIKANFTLESPIIELYLDDDLTLKIGELSVDTMITK